MSGPILVAIAPRYAAAAHEMLAAARLAEIRRQHDEWFDRFRTNPMGVLWMVRERLGQALAEAEPLWDVRR